MHLRPIVTAFLLVHGLPATAESPASPAAEVVTIAHLGDVMQLDDLFAVLHDEGIAYGRDLEADMFPSGGGQGWADAVDRIYDAPRLRAGFNQQLRAGLASDPQALAAIGDFFGSELGSRIVALEIEARRAFLDEAAEDAARVAADKGRANRDPRSRQIDRFIEASDLIDMNVAGALSGNLAFLTGLNEAGANGEILPADEILRQVWEQEAQIRDDTESWLYSYLGLAYSPLTEVEMDNYIAFWESPAGQRLNGVLFTAFNKVYSGVSRDLGHAAGQAMLGRDI